MVYLIMAILILSGIAALISVIQNIARDNRRWKNYKGRHPKW